MGITVVREQPQLVEIGGKVFCIGHGDGLGPGLRGYRFMNAVFKNRVTQWLFSLLHPWIAFRLGNGWSRRSRLARGDTYVFKGSEEPVYKWSEEFSSRQHVDAVIFGHLHCEADLTCLFKQAPHFRGIISRHFLLERIFNIIFLPYSASLNCGK